MVEDSVLAAAVAHASVIPNGVDLEAFAPRDRTSARRNLGIALDAFVVAFSAAGGRANTWKDYGTLRAALGSLEGGGPTVLVVLGERQSVDRIGSVDVVSAGMVDRGRVPAILAAADAYVHPSLADTFPMAVIEALAMGLPVVASAVGGIPEQVASLGKSRDPTGIRLSPASVRELAEALRRLRDDVELRHGIGDAARRDALARFDGRRVVAAYESVYQTALRTHGHAA